jgi:hypothetical protein
MTRVIALTALAVLGLSGAPFHEPFHARRRASFHGRNRAQRPGLPVSDARRPGRARSSGKASPGHCPGPGSTPRRPQRPRRATSPGRPHRHARRPGRARPAVPRRTRPGSPHRLSPRNWDGERQMPACGHLISGIMPATGDHIAPGPGMMPDHAGDPGTVPSI